MLRNGFDTKWYVRSGISKTSNFLKWCHHWLYLLVVQGILVVYLNGIFKRIEFLLIKNGNITNEYHYLTYVQEEKMTISLKFVRFCVEYWPFFSLEHIKYCNSCIHQGQLSNFLYYGEYDSSKVGDFTLENMVMSYSNWFEKSTVEILKNLFHDLL